MITTLARAAFALSLLSYSFAQDRFFSEIPTEEETALNNVVEDEAPPPSFNRGSGWESPVYNQIYASPLPIPPVKQPKK